MKIENLVVICDFSTLRGGAEKIALLTAKIMAGTGINVTFFCSSTEHDSEILRRNIDIISTMQERFGVGKVTYKKIMQGLWNRKSLKSLLQTLSGFDKSNTLVHVHSWGSSLSPSIFNAIRKSNIRCIVTAHDYLLACPNSCFFNYQTCKVCSARPYSCKCLFMNCDKDGYAQSVYRFLRGVIQRYEIHRLRPTIIYLNEFQKAKIEIPSAKLQSHGVIVPNPNPPVNVSALKRKIIPGDYYIFVGRLVPGKGLKLFCDAITTVGCRGVVYGTGELEEEYKANYPDIEFRGWGDASEISQAMSNCRSLVFPSEFYEAAPLAPYEAKCNGVPAIVSSECAGSRYIIDGINGLLFEAGSVRDLERCIQFLLSDESILKMKQNISEELMQTENYTVEDYMSKLLSLYEDILEGK